MIFWGPISFYDMFYDLFNDYFMIFRFFLEISMKSKEIPRKITKKDETPLNSRKNNKSPKTIEKS